MTDIFDNRILCKNCNIVMAPAKLMKNGFVLRAVRCKKCNETLVHPVDKQEYDNFMDLRKKEFSVKMRMVGNSYAVSIPREIVDFMQEQEKIMDDIVKLSFDDVNKLSLMFNLPSSSQNSRVIKAKEIKIVKNNKPVLHAKQFYDSAHPERNKNIILKSKKSNEEEIENGR